MISAFDQSSGMTPSSSDCVNRAAIAGAISSVISFSTYSIRDLSGPDALWPFDLGT